MHHMNKTATSARPGSIVLIASPSGYFGSTGVSAYVASKHGVVGLLRASQVEARKRGNIRVNGVAPGLTPTAMTAGYSQRWKDTGMEANTVENVAGVIAQTAVDARLNGACVLVSFGVVVPPRSSLMAQVPANTPTLNTRLRVNSSASWNRLEQLLPVTG